MRNKYRYGFNAVEHPAHYTQHESGVECISIAEGMNFCLGNTLKYIWRADFKSDAITDLKKAAWYLAREIRRRKKARGNDIIAEHQEGGEDMRQEIKTGESMNARQVGLDEIAPSEMLLQGTYTELVEIMTRIRLCFADLDDDQMLAVANWLIRGVLAASDEARKLTSDN